MKLVYNQVWHEPFRFAFNNTRKNMEKHIWDHSYHVHSINHKVGARVWLHIRIPMIGNLR